MHRVRHGVSALRNRKMPPAPIWFLDGLALAHHGQRAAGGRFGHQLADDAATADALSTAFSLMDERRIETLRASLGNVEVHLRA